jgi:hypothetical protein
MYNMAAAEHGLETGAIRTMLNGCIAPHAELVPAKDASCVLGAQCSGCGHGCCTPGGAQHGGHAGLASQLVEH